MQFAPVGEQAPGSFHVISDPMSHITVYDEMRIVRGQAEGNLWLSLPPGAYRVHLERGGDVYKEVVVHGDATRLVHAGPPLRSPVPFAEAATSHDDHVEPARRLSVTDTAPPLGSAPHTSRLFVFVRRIDREARPRDLPSEPVTIHDVDGRLLAAIAAGNPGSEADHGYVAYSCRAAAGTYRVRSARSRRDVAITIPHGRAAHVFIPDTGFVWLDDLRVSLGPASAGFDPKTPIWSAMESVLVALRTPGRRLPAAARALLPGAVEDDLCFGIAAAHVLWRSADRQGAAAVMTHLAKFRELPDIAILELLHAPLRPPVAMPVAPPLLRESLALAMTRPELAPCEISPDGALAQAARTYVDESVWCTWSARPWDERWIEAAVARLRAQDGRLDAAEVARTLALPRQTIECTLQALDATTPGADVTVPGYTLGELLGRGDHSTVVRATRDTDRSEVALKLVPVHGGSSRCARVLGELDRIKPLVHPQVVGPSARGVLPGDSGLWFEMPRCRGSVLDLLVEADAPLPVAEAHRLIVEALAGLAKLHDMRIAHGAIAPRNLLVREDGSAAIADVRLVTSWVTASESRTASSGAGFIAPELLGPGALPQRASDVWSMAATLYYLLTLELPRERYAGQSERDAVYNDIVPIATRRPDLPQELVRCIHRALSFELVRRPPHAEAFRKLLTAVDVTGATPFAQGVLSGRDSLPAAAQLLHEFCFDRVELDVPKLGNEPRWSCQCKRECAAVWIASKSGHVMRMALSTVDGRPKQTWFPGNREARTIYHQHDGRALGGGCFLLIGRDNGALDIISDRHPDWSDRPSLQRNHESPGSFHLQSWWERRDEVGVRAIDQGFECAHDDVDGNYAIGVTAIAVLPRRGRPDIIDILVATRYPSLYVVEATCAPRPGSRCRLRLVQRVEMPGWINWIIAPQKEGDPVLCISRGGDVVRLSRSELLAGSPGTPRALSLLPTAAMPFGELGVLLGTTTGLFLVHGDPPEAIAVPVTRSPVLCLDQAVVESEGNIRDYVVMGLEDGRMRVVGSDLLRALASGVKMPETFTRSFAIDARSAVLAVETLRPDHGPRDTAYVLAVLRDHSVRLYRVTSPEAQRALVTTLWGDHVRRAHHAVGRTKPAGTAFDRELSAASADELPDCEDDAWNYMKADVVLPRLCDAAANPDERRQVVALACQMTTGADRRVLHRLSVALDQLAGGDIGLMLMLSRSVLAAVPHDHDRRWHAFIDSHLRELHAITQRIHDDDRSRLVAWTRFVRKYVLLGNTFSTKQTGLAELVSQNHEAHKYLDALIYQTLLFQRGYDLRWEVHLDADVAGLHTVDCGDGRTLVVVVTTSATLALFDGATGSRLKIQEDATERDALVPFPAARTLACTVASGHGSQLRVVVSCEGPIADAPALAVFDLRWPAPATSAVKIIARDLGVECADPRAQVHALAAMPGDPDVFVVGLETRDRPIGLLQRRPGGWVLDVCELENDDHADRDGGRVEHLAPGKVPTRALAVAAVDDPASSYLAVAGSDDGVVRAILFGRGVPTRDWTVTRWDRVADPVTTVVLGRHPGSSLRGNDSLLSCYLGTAAGDTFALSIVAHDHAGETTTAAPFHYEAHPLWRETHDGPILTSHLWRTPLYLPEEVLVVITGTGRLGIYNHAYTGRDRVSASSNYYFRGMRFDRIAMPGRVRAFSVVAGTRTCVAADAERRLYMVSLAYLRDSVDPIETLPPDRTAHGQRAPDPQPPGPGLPREIWARLRHLMAQSRHHEPLLAGPHGAAEVVRHKLELCDLIRLDGGALSSHALHERLWTLESWDALNETNLTRKAGELLYMLDPGRREDASRIKVIVKSLCRARLFRNPASFGAAVLAAPEAATDRHAETAATCELMAGYLRHSLAQSTPASARLRIVVVKELLRVPALRYMVLADPHAPRVRRAIESVLETCLGDDDRLVRIEALRAVSVMLRNVGVMADEVANMERSHRRRRRARRKLIEAFFPDGLGSLEWLLELIVTGLQQFRGFTRRTALVSGAWYYISPVLPLFRLFPDRTLALCDYLIRAGLGVEVVAACFQSLRRRGAATIRKRIEYLYLLPALERKHARTEYIEQYARSNRPRVLRDELRVKPPKAPASNQRWYEVDDAAMADRLTWLLDRLARMWAVSSRERHQAIAKFKVIAATDREAPLGALEDVVAKLAAIKDELVTASPGGDRLVQLARLGSWYSVSVERNPVLTAPIRTIVAGIIAVWRDIYDPPRVREGATIDIYELGECISDRGRASVFRLARPLERKDTHVIKVLQRSNLPDAPQRFLDGARLNKKLHKRSPDRKYIVPITYVHNEPPYAYVMLKYKQTLEDCLTAEFHGAHARRWTEKAAEHIGRALQATHGERCHGNVKATNILVRLEDREPVFCLGDFSLPDASDDAIAVGPAGIVPNCLSQRYAGDSEGRRKWDDIAALSLILYRMLTGTTVDPRRTTDLRVHLARLCALAGDPRYTGRVRAVIDTLIRVFKNDEPALSIQEFLTSVASDVPRPIPAIDPHPPEVRPPPWLPPNRHSILFLAANPAGTQRLALEEECKAIEKELRGTPYGRSHFDFQSKFAVNIHDMGYWLFELQPTVIHFSGHGGAVELDGRGQPMSPPRDIRGAALAGIHLQDDQRQSRHVPGEQLANLIRTHSAFKSGRVVVLNACYTDEVAGALLGVVDCVVGMRGPILDNAARDFAIAFYCGLGSAVSVGQAFQRGVAVLSAGQGQPVILPRPGVDENQLFLVRRAMEHRSV